MLDDLRPAASKIRQEGYAVERRFHRWNTARQVSVASPVAHVCWYGCFEKWHIDESDYRAGRFQWKERA
jgi:hypothetical protein